MSNQSNIAYIDGQNLHMNTKAHGWSVDLARFRVYLREKYHAETAYYFLGAVDESQQALYENIQKAGFVLSFREHSQSMIGKKKGNVDTDIVFHIMEKIAEHEKFDKIILVSGDGDYYRTVQYLVGKGKFAKLLAPNKKSMSSLYRPLTPKFTDYLDRPDIQKKIAYKKKTK